MPPARRDEPFELRLIMMRPRPPLSAVAGADAMSSVTARASS
jgi:hypothetical protein